VEEQAAPRHAAPTRAAAGHAAPTRAAARPAKGDPARSPARASGVEYAPHRPIGTRNRLSHAVRRARERSAVRGYRAAAAAISRVPPGISVPLGRAVFLGGYFAWPHKRRIILANASHVLGLPASDRRVRHLARRIYATYARFVVELMRLSAAPADEPARILRAGGERGEGSFIALFERLRSEGRGLIAVSAHVGSIDVLAGAFALRGLPTYGLADDSGYPELFEEMNAQRRRWGIQVIPWRNMRRVFAALREPAILGLVVDWGYRPDGVPVRLFGEWTALPAGPALLAAKTRAAIVPVVCRRQPDGSYDASHYDPIEVADTSPAELQRATQAIAAAVEDMISTAPDQWYSFKPIWPATADEKADLARRAASDA